MATSGVNKKQSLVSAKDLSLIYRVIKANWWIPLIILPLAYAIGSFYVYRLTVSYKASTEFLLKNNDTYYQSNVLSDANFYNYGGYVDNLNEIRIIQSYDLASKVVEKLMDRLQVSYFIVGKVRTTEQFNGMPFKVTVKQINPGYYEVPIDIRVVDFDNYQISIGEGSNIKTLSGKFNTDLIDTDLIINVSRIDLFTKNKEKDFQSMLYQFTIHTKEFLINKIRSNLTAENITYTNILKVDLVDILPERAVLILDTMNTVYAMGKLKSKFDLNERTIEYIDRQLSEITFSLKGLEDTMQNYKQRKNIIDLNWEQGDFLSKIGSYDNQRSDFKMQIEALNDLERYIIEDRDPQFLPPNVFITEKSGFMLKAVNELYNKQIDLNRMYSVAKENNPLISELKNSIKKTKQDLLVYINNSRKATKQQIENVEKEILNYLNEARQIPGKQRDLLNIQRKTVVSEQLYNFLLEKKASTKIARAGIISDIKIVESPRYIGADDPDRITKIQKQFVSAGLFLALFIIFIRMFYFSRIESVEHLKELTSLPLLGVLPFIKKEETEGIIVDNNPNSLISESFRNFRTNLQYANVDSHAKTYLITSFLPGEGKTFTSTNLATILAKSGKKTVLLELDLHKPRIFKRFNLQNQDKGITTFISGLNSLEEIITETRIENLHCIFSGPIPPNPSEFILSEKLKELIAFAKNNYDYVIIDSPPAGLLSDSVFMIQYVDASIFVLNTRSSNKKVITFIEELIENNNLKNINLLLNGVKNLGRKYYYRGYGYSYGYGYGYGYGKGYGKNSGYLNK
ncbi:MAG: polysaccharide biosynthesis tyrosine autokinase [Sphingobacteriaceae bacterium]|nr:polysaccharide biosynthesis tyrosine autokinase [Sphingobacteriaceae bacterium]